MSINFIYTHTNAHDIPHFLTRELLVIRFPPISNGIVASRIPVSFPVVRSTPSGEASNTEVFFRRSFFFFFEVGAGVFKVFSDVVAVLRSVVASAVVRSVVVAVVRSSVEVRLIVVVRLLRARDEGSGT